MKEINLISLLQAYEGLNQPLYEGYINIFNINPKENELQDLDCFVKDLQKFSSESLFKFSCLEIRLLIS